MKYSFCKFTRNALAIVFILSFSSVYSQSLLYSVTGNGLKHPAYIYGTIHALPQSDFFMDEQVIEKLGEAQKVVLEIDMSNPSMVMEVQAAMMMKDNSIDKLISADDYTRLQQFFADSLQIPIEMVKQVKPLMISSFLLLKLIGEPLASYEAFFVQKAMELGKPLDGLETVAEQIGYMDKIPLSQQAKMLVTSIDDFEESRIEFKNLVAAYKSREVEKIYSVMMETSVEYKEFGEYLIDARNKNWIPKIVDFANQQITFIAVGCGHLGGGNGVLDLLRNLGYTVERID